jgi:hypothetical protein
VVVLRSGVGIMEWKVLETAKHQQGNQMTGGENDAEFL